MQHRDRGAVGNVLAVGVVVGALIVGAGWIGVDLLHNPVRVEAIDHSPPPVLTELRDLADFHASQARFEVVVDEERDVHLVPQFIAGERVQFVAVGSVDAVVDFAALTDSSIVVDEEGTGVVITLPAPAFADPVVDVEQSHVMNRDRGLLDRLGGALVDNPTSEQELFVLAGEKMAASAASTDLLVRAEENTTKMLTGMLGALGYERVAVVFTPVD